MIIVSVKIQTHLKCDHRMNKTCKNKNIQSKYINIYVEISYIKNTTGDETHLLFKNVCYGPFVFLKFTLKLSHIKY